LQLSYYLVQMGKNLTVWNSL